MRKLYIHWVLTFAAILLFISSCALYYSDPPGVTEIPPICIAPFTIRALDQQNGPLTLKGDQTIDMRTKEITYSYFVHEPEKYHDLFFNRKLDVDIKRIYPEVYSFTIKRVTILPTDNVGNLLDAYFPDFYIGATLKFNVRRYQPGIYSVIADDRLHSFCSAL